MHELLFRNFLKIGLILFLIFGFYIHIFGEDSVGGGFQAGVLMASIFIILDLSSSIHLNKWKRLTLLVLVFSLVLYYGLGFLSLIFKLEFLNYEVFRKIFGFSSLMSQRIGIFIVESLILTAVCASIISIYIAFSSVKIAKK